MNESRTENNLNSPKRRRTGLERLMNLSAARALYSRDEKTAEAFDRYASRLRKRIVKGHV